MVGLYPGEVFMRAALPRTRAGFLVGLKQQDNAAIGGPVRKGVRKADQYCHVPVVAAFVADAVKNGTVGNVVIHFMYRKGV